MIRLTDFLDYPNNVWLYMDKKPAEVLAKRIKILAEKNNCSFKQLKRRTNLYSMIMLPISNKKITIIYVLAVNN